MREVAVQELSEWGIEKEAIESSVVLIYASFHRASDEGPSNATRTTLTGSVASS